MSEDEIDALMDQVEDLDELDAVQEFLRDITSWIGVNERTE